MKHARLSLALIASTALAALRALAGPAKDDALARGNNEFGLALYARLAAAGKGNIFCSPYSVSSALAMTYAGARKETARQMATTLRFSLPDERLHEEFGRLTAELNKAGSGGRFSLAAANALWGRKGAGFKKAFLDLVRRGYGAGLTELDFAADAESARRTINAWVEEKTRDKIKDLLARGVVDASTKLVLTNAIYFKGNWRIQFDKAATKDEPFFTPGGEAPVPMMSRTGEAGYMEDESLQALELPYQGERLSMVLLLPRARDGLKAVEESLTESGLALRLKALRFRKVKIQLPRFRTEAAFRLNEALGDMGMADAFSAAADFSGMTGKPELSISAVVHKAFVDVNEEGTEAAAATAVVMTKGASLGPVPAFRADHPFLFLIRDRESGSILFLGRLADPRP